MVFEIYDMIVYIIVNILNDIWYMIYTIYFNNACIMLLHTNEPRGSPTAGQVTKQLCVGVSGCYLAFVYTPLHSTHLVL